MSWPVDTTVEEAVFQALHAVDAAQTLDIRHRPPLFESESALGAGWAIGARPSDHAVWAYMGAEAALHLAVTAALVRLGAPRWATTVWEAVTISVDGVAVANNARLGLRVHL